MIDMEMRVPRPLMWGAWLAAMQRRLAASGATPDARDKALDLADFEAFFRRHEPQVSGYLWRMTGDEQAAYDLSQETFLRAWEHYVEIRAYPRPVAWLFRVATNLALNHRRWARSPIHAAASLEDHDPFRSDPANAIVQREIVRQTLLALPERSRALLILREVYGLSCQEAAKMIGISHDAAKMALCRAREQFRAVYLRKEGERP